MAALQKLLLLACAVAAERISANDVKDADTWDADREHVYKKLAKSNIQQRAIHREGVGVMYAAAGSPEFVRREVLPTVDYLKQLGIADARGAHASVRNHGFALFTERVLVNELTSTEKDTLSNFFDRILLYEDWSLVTTKKLPLKTRAKLVKVHAMASSPFATTIFMDFDSRPCSASFLERLLLVGNGVDVALTNKFDGQESHKDHLKLEHNSALIVLDSTSKRTQAFLGYYVDAFMKLYERTGDSRDQPSLTIALRRAVESVSLNHADLAPDLFCRSKISDVVSCDAGCALVHKPQKHDLSFKTFALSASKAGGERVAMMLDALKLEPRCDVKARLTAFDDYARSLDSTKALEIARDYRTFYDAPWNAGTLYEDLAIKYPRARFVLTVRDSSEWYDDVERELSCASQKQRTSYERANGLGPLDREAWIQAYEQRNSAIVAFFSKRSEAHRLLVLPNLDTAQPKKTWEALCNFLEAWSTCPSNRIIPRTRVKTKPRCETRTEADTLSELAKRTDAAGKRIAAKRAEQEHPPTPPPELSVLERYKAKVRAHLAQQKEPDTKPPKPPKRIHKVLTSAERKKLRRAYPSAHAPKWHPLCEPKHPRGVLYNRIPKSGSASIMSWMSGQLNETAKHKFHLKQTDVTWWTPHIAKHRWLDATDLKKYLAAIATYGQKSRFVTQRHVYYPEGVENTHSDGVALVNLIRDPIDRCVSRYNYEAFYKKRIPAVDFDACLDGGRCDFRNWDPRTEKHRYQDFPVPKRKEGATDTEWDIFQRLSYNESMRLLADECHDYTVRWFCGHGPECRDPSRPELALQIAKRNVRERYAHVGILTDLENTAQLFRLLLPDFFEGDPSRDPDETDFPALHQSVPKDRVKGGKSKSAPLSPHNLELLYEINKRDMELYYYILELHHRRVRVCLRTNGDPPGKNHGEAGEVPSWATHDVDAILA